MSFERLLSNPHHCLCPTGISWQSEGAMGTRSGARELRPTGSQAWHFPCGLIQSQTREGWRLQLFMSCCCVCFFPVPSPPVGRRASLGLVGCAFNKINWLSRRPYQSFMQLYYWESNLFCLLGGGGGGDGLGGWMLHGPDDIDGEGPTLAPERAHLIWAFPGSYPVQMKAHCFALKCFPFL